MAKTGASSGITEKEFSYAVLQETVERAISGTKTADGGIAARFAEFSDPRAQTAF